MYPVEHIWVIMLKILQAHLLCAFVANLKIDALYPESFCYKNLAIRKVFAFCDSGGDAKQSNAWIKISCLLSRAELLCVAFDWREMGRFIGIGYFSPSLYIVPLLAYTQYRITNEKSVLYKKFRTRLQIHLDDNT